MQHKVSPSPGYVYPNGRKMIRVIQSNVLYLPGCHPARVVMCSAPLGTLYSTFIEVLRNGQKPSMLSEYGGMTEEQALCDFKERVEGLCG